MNQNQTGAGGQPNHERPPLAKAGSGKPVDDRTRVRSVRPSGHSPQKPPPRRKKKVRKLSIFRMVMVNIMKAFVVTLCIMLVVFSVAAVQVVQYIVKETNDDDNVLDIDNIKASLNQTSYIMILNPDNPNAKAQGDWIAHQELVGAENRIWVQYDQIPKDLVNAVVATEDRDFWNHHGVSFQRTIQAGLNEIIQYQDKTFGASTIHQQLVKNITGEKEIVGKDGDRSAGYQRKLREIFRAWSLANRYSKDMVMEAYLNTMGLSERLAGVQAGALEYFGKEVKDLTLAECALIAGITQSPTKHSPYRNPEAARTRRNNVLGFMLVEGYITQTAYEEARTSELNVKPRTEKTNEAQKAIFSYDVDMVFNAVKRDLVKEGRTEEEAAYYIRNGGLKIYSTVDLKVQRALEDIYADGYAQDGFFMDESRFPGYTRLMTATEVMEKDADGKAVREESVLPQSAACVTNFDGELVAIVGGIGEKTESLSLNRAWGTVTTGTDGQPKVEGTVRQVGSTMKAVAAYALGIDQGYITYSSGVFDGPIRDRVPGSGKMDWPKNYGSGNNWKMTSLPIVSAVAESTNTIAVQVGDWVGVEEMFEYLQDTVQVSSLVDPQDKDLGPLVLGSMTYGMSAYELAGAFSVFGGNDSYGTFTDLHCYSSVEDSRGNIVLEPEYYTRQAIDPQSGYVMNRLLWNVLNGSNLPGGVAPTAKGMAPAGEMDAVAKTGTTSDDRDRWFVGLTPYYVTSVWWGYDNPDQNNLGRWGPGSRTNIPVNVWKTLMETVQAELEVKQFPEVPEGITKSQFCSASGQLKGPYCPSGGEGYYTSFKLPEVCTAHSSAPAEPAA